MIKADFYEIGDDIPRLFDIQPGLMHKPGYNLHYKFAQSANLRSTLYALFPAHLTRASIE